jgi:CubicO group peptidase (beta-lactamase class C family)
MLCTEPIRRIACGLGVLVWLVSTPGVGGQQPVGEDAFPEFNPLIQAKVDELELPGAAFLVVKDGQVLYSNTFGDFTMDTVFPIMSATKWITVGVIMSLVDEGVLALDDPVSKYLPEFREGKKAEITIRQCLACTSGITWRVMAIYRTDMDFAEAVREVAKEPLEADPGSELIYGGTGFHVAGRVAEVASGKGWHELFEERIKKPLGMMDSVYGSRDPANRRNLLPIPASNPWLGGGLITSMNGYATFVQMLLDQGMYRGRRVLSAESVREMRIDQSRDAAVTRTLHPDPNTHYTLGAWVERVAPDGEAHQIRDMGAWGFNPWVDYERGYFAIFGTQDELRRVWGLTKELEEIIQTKLDAESELKHISEDVFRERWGPGENGAEAVFYIVEGLGHQWPGGARISPNERLGPTSSALDATGVMWEFFERHHRSGF